MINSNIFHNIGNTLISLFGVVALIDPTLLPPQIAAPAAAVVAIAKIIVNIKRDGVTGLVAPQPPVAKS